MKVIKTYSELHHCLRAYDVFYKSERYKLKIPQWDADENNRVSNKINSYSKKYGCNSGNFFMTTAFILYAIYYFCNGGTFSAIGADEFIWILICTISGAVTGKLLGLTYTRWRMIKFTDQLLKGEHLSL
jgi:hypothetical protein